jgi:P27 family predicted phage terminase small subunit
MTVASIHRMPTPSQPKPPKGLSKDAARLWAELQGVYGVTDPAGLLLLETACKSYDDWATARERVDREGLLVADRQGGTKLNPAQRAVKDSHNAMMQALRMLHFDVEPKLPPGRPGGQSKTI